MEEKVSLELEVFTDRAWLVKFNRSLSNFPLIAWLRDALPIAVTIHQALGLPLRRIHQTCCVGDTKTVFSRPYLSTPRSDTSSTCLRPFLPLLLLSVLFHRDSSSYSLREESTTHIVLWQFHMMVECIGTLFGIWSQLAGKTYEEEKFKNTMWLFIRNELRLWFCLVQKGLLSLSRHDWRYELRFRTIVLSCL